MKYRQHPVLSTLVILGLGLYSGVSLSQQDHSSHQQDDTSHSAQAGDSDSGAMDHGRQGEMMNHGDGQGGAMGRGDGGRGGMMNRGGGGGMMNRGGGGGTMNRGDGGRGGAAQETASVGQSAFAVIQDVITRLQANPQTDWTRVNVAALRQHLVDMDRVVMAAEAEADSIDGGNRYLVTGPDQRTVAAIQRMVPAHALQMERELGWQISIRQRDDGIELSVSSAQADDVAMIRGLGFFGFMAVGDHHADHHLMMAGGRADGAEAAMDHGAGDQADHSQH